MITAANGKRAMRPDDILRIRWVTDPEISPDGRRVAYVVTTLDEKKNEYRSHIKVVDIHSGETRQLTNGPKRDTTPRWSPDGKQIAFVSERGEEKAQVWVIDADGGEAWRLSQADEAAANPAWSPDGGRIAFVSKMDINPAERDPDGKPYPKVRKITTFKYKSNGEGLIDDRRSHIFLVDVDLSARQPAKAIQLTRGDFNNGGPVRWSPDGHQVAFTSARHANRDRDLVSDLWVLDVPGRGDAPGAPLRLTRTAGPVGLPAWSPDGKQIAYIGHAKKGLAPGRHHGVWTVDVDDGEPRFLSGALDRNCNSGVEPFWSADSSTVFFGALDDGNDHIYSIATGEGPPVPVLTGERQVTWATSANGSVAFLATDPTHPAEVFLCAADGSGERQLSSENATWLDEVALSPRLPIGAKSADGTAVSAWVIRPPAGAASSGPCLVNVHGGPKSQYGSNFFDEFQVYAAAGYTVVYGNPRGSDGYGEDWALAVLSAWGEHDWADVTAIAGAAFALDGVDPARVGIMGGSYGGFMTSWAVGHTDRFRAACSERAVNNAYSMVGTSDIGFNFMLDQVGGRPATDIGRFLQSSPLSYVDKIHTPLLILHSENDLRCPIEQAEQLYVGLKLLRRPVEFWRFPEDNHEMSRSGKPRNRLKRFKIILDWFGRKL